MDCVKGCEFREYKDDWKFHCTLYNEQLPIETKDLGGGAYTVKTLRCERCIEEGEIGNNTSKEKIKKLKTHIGWMMDFFYSFKDDMEEEVSNIYRIVKELEKELDS